MRFAALLYHDVIENGRFEDSGFPRAGAAKYKLDRPRFEEQVRLVHAAMGGPGWRIGRPGAMADGARPFIFTFDDGGVSAHRLIADALERHGSFGHFFIVTDMIGRPGFLAADEIRDLWRRGHVIGSHTCSHPARISACTSDQLADEWGRSIRVLSDLLGESIAVGSIPAGYYTRRVARAAAFAGISQLFTCEPTTRPWSVGTCTLFGRFGIARDTPDHTVVDLAAGRDAARLKQFVAWNTKKVIKRLGGNLYLKLRTAMLSRTGDWKHRHSV